MELPTELIFSSPPAEKLNIFYNNQYSKNSNFIISYSLFNNQNIKNYNSSSPLLLNENINNENLNSVKSSTIEILDNLLSKKTKRQRQNSSNTNNSFKSFIKQRDSINNQKEEYKYSNKENININYNFSVKKNLISSLDKEKSLITPISKINLQNNNNSNTKSNNSKSSKSSANSFYSDGTTGRYLKDLSSRCNNFKCDKMVDFIVQTNKVYNKNNRNKSFESFLNDFGGHDHKDMEKKCEVDEVVFDNNFFENINESSKTSSCKCKRTKCIKYSCSCLKMGNKCNAFCNCLNCKNNKERYIILKQK